MMIYDEEMNSFVYSLEEQEKHAREREDRLIKRLQNLKLSQEKAEIFKGMRTQNMDFSEHIKDAEKELKDFTEQNAHLLI